MYFREQYKELIKKAWRVTVRKTSQKSMVGLIEKTVSQAIFIQSGKTTQIRNSQVMVRWQRVSGMMQHRRVSSRASFNLSDLGK